MFRVYINPFDDDGNYTGFVDVSKYVNLTSLSDITQDIDSTEYQLGVFRYPNLQLKLDNKSGKFSDVENVQSIFRFRRADSQVKVTYSLMNEGPYCGVAICGGENAYLSEEVQLYVGLINDESFSTSVRNQDVTVKVLGFESVFSRAVVPFSALSNGMLISDAIYAILNQVAVTKLLTVNEANIVPDLDLAIDDVSDFETMTVKEALDKLLVTSNSVLYIRDQVIYVSNRDATAAVQATFYGQAAIAGAEEVADIKELKNGVAKVFNFITWASTNLSNADADSVTRYGVRKLELDYGFITDSGKRVTIMANIAAEFASAKQEFTLVVPINYNRLALKLLDRIIVDYPTVYLQGEEPVPVCGVFEYGVAVLPEALWSLTITTDENYKIVSKKIVPRAGTIEFKVRKI